MDLNEDEIIEVPVLRLYPLPDEDDTDNSGKGYKNFGNITRSTDRFLRSGSFRSEGINRSHTPDKFRRTGSFRSEGLSRSQTPDRLLFPGEQRPKSAACILRELQTPTKCRQRNSIRQDPEIDNAQHLPEAPKKVSREELETIVSRLQRQTNSGRARTALTRRINQQKQEYVNPTRIDYLAFDPVRFRGLRKVSKDEMESIVLRLSSYQKDRKPAESERYHIAKENHKKLGVLNSYRWKGIHNC